VGGGDQPHVGPNRLVAADPLERLLLQQAQDLALQGRRHVADLVQEQRAAVALLELADAAAVGAGEGALLVPEQLALQELLRDGGAVQGQKRGVGPPGVLVDGPGDQFLAGAALAGDQHRHVLGGHPADRLVHLQHGRAGADDGPVHLGVGKVYRNHSRLAHAPGHFQRLADHPPQLGQVERLEEVVVGPLFHCLDGRVRPLGHRDEDDWDARVDSADGLVDVQAGLVGQAQVQEDHVRRFGPDALNPVRPRAGHLDPVGGGGERLAHLHRDQGRVVVDEQEVGHGRLTPRAPAESEGADLL
jgi:hypothetical protein